MPIRVHHGPSPLVVGQAAYETGLDQARNREEQERLREQERRQRMAIQQREMQLRQAQAQEEAMMDRRSQLLRELQAGRDYDLGVGRLQQRAAQHTPGLLGLSAAEAEGRVPMGTGFDSSGLGLDPYLEQQYQLSEVRNLEDQVKSVRKQMAQIELTPEGRRIYGELSGSLRAIQSQRDTLRPQQYSELLNKWLGNFEQAGIDSYVKPPPTIEGELERRKLEFPNNRVALLQPDGEIDWLESHDPSKEGSSGGAIGEGESVSPPSLGGIYADKEDPREAWQEFNKDYESFQDSLMKRKSMGRGADAPAPSLPKEKEVLDEMKKRFRAFQGIAGQAEGEQKDDIMSPSVEGGESGPQGRQATVSPGRLSAEQTEAKRRLMEMAPEQRVRVLMQNHPETKGATVEDIMQTPEMRENYQKFAEAAREGLVDPLTYREFVVQHLDDFLKKQLDPYAGRDAIEGRRVDDIKDPELKKEVENLPKPRSKQDVSQLPPGSHFVDPEGVIRIAR